jgi:hypothetical protein
MKLEPVVQSVQTRSRALSQSFLQYFSLEGGVYSPVVELVHKNKDLHLEFHGQLNLKQPDVTPADEAIGIYYKGNCILGLHSNHKVVIHDAFTSGLKIPRYLRNGEDVKEYLTFVPELMYRVASYEKKSMEIEYEQMIIRANNREKRNNSEYIILANQYDVGKRWDLLAVKWPRKAHGGNNPIGYLTLIEVKYALNKDIQNADQQIAGYYNYINQHLNSLCDEMQLVLRQKLMLGLIERTPEQMAQLKKLKLSRDIKDVEIIVFLIDYNPNSILVNKMIEKASRLPFKNQIRIRHGGLAMWDLSSQTL